MIKLVNFERGHKAENPGGGIVGANGYRYWTISVSNLDEIAAKCEAAGYKIAVPVTTIRPGTAIAMVEDPDGNWVEFLASV
jgi:glyoxylase I family protein